MCFADLTCFKLLIAVAKNGDMGDFLDTWGPVETWTNIVVCFESLSKPGTRRSRLDLQGRMLERKIDNIFLLSHMFSCKDAYASYIARRRASAAVPDTDVAAGEGDAEYEGMMENDGEEEHPIVDDALVEVAPAKPLKPPLAAVTLTGLLDDVKEAEPLTASTDAMWLPVLKKQRLMKMTSATSISEASVAPTTLCTPSPKPGQSGSSLTPSPVSPPVLVKEVYLIPESH